MTHGRVFCGVCRNFAVCLVPAIVLGCADVPSQIQQPPQASATIAALAPQMEEPASTPRRSRSRDAFVPVPKLPTAAAGDTPLPINLPTALTLSSTVPLDIALASERIRQAMAELDQANVLWLPSIQTGADYFRHDGRNQDATSGIIFDNERSTFMIGAAPTAEFAVTDAIFAPLAARQELQARQADHRAATNNSFLAVAEAYFDVQQARGEVAGAEDAERRTAKLVEIAEGLAPAVIPLFEVSRIRTELARRQQVTASAWERWRMASIALTRVLRLDAGALVQPLEPPQIKIALMAPDLALAALIDVAIASRPELASQKALVQAALQRLRQETYRPLIPSVLLRGASTTPTGTLAGGVYGSGLNGDIGHFGARLDYDVQVIWQLDNLGFGYAAKVAEKRSEHQLSYYEQLRVQDRIMAEVADARAQLRSATVRTDAAATGLQQAFNSVEKNFENLRQTKKVVFLVRPQEVVASIQALGQAYTDYYGSIADYNRAQFRLYWALGNPAQLACLGFDLDPGWPCPSLSSPSRLLPPLEETNDHGP
jgi:outer membrane protein TolC